MIHYEDMEITTNLPIPFSPTIKPPAEKGQPMAFVPIFETREEAEEWSDDGQIEIVRIALGRRPNQEIENA